MKKSKTLLKLKNIAKLESMITQGADYETILKLSQKIDEYIIEEMLRINNESKKEVKK